MTSIDFGNALERGGLSPSEAEAKAQTLARLLGVLGGRRAAADAWNAWFVPGRIEVLGKHTDYAGGRSLLCAAERGFAAVVGPRADAQVMITDTRSGVTVAIDASSSAHGPRWGTYPATVVRRFSRNFPDARRGADIVFESDLPSAAGLSSSSALMIVVLLALLEANDLSANARWTQTIGKLEDLAAYAATIENGSTFRSLAGEAGVGTEGGSEDHTAILCSHPGRLAQYSFRPTRRERAIPLSPDLVFAIGVSGVAARKTGAAMDDYNRASRNVARILERWRVATGRHDETLAVAIASAPDAAERLRALIRDSPDASDAAVLTDRLNQFVEESTVLVPAAADALARDDLTTFGVHVARSQELAERLLRNQVPETMALVRAARDHGAIAASAFGAGFGGSVWALVDTATAPAFLDRWQDAYRAACPEAAVRSTFFLTPAGPPAIRLT